MLFYHLGIIKNSLRAIIRPTEYNRKKIFIKISKAVLEGFCYKHGNFMY